MDRRERLLNLLAALLESRNGLTTEEILTEGSLGYEGATESARKAFERDKRSLRAMGVPLDQLGSNEDHRYRVDPEAYYLPDLGLSSDEVAALHLAVTAISLGNDDGAAGHGALMKLGGREGDRAQTIAELPIVPALAPVFEATRRRAPVRFAYKGEARHLEPWGLSSKRGRWYVVGFDLDRGQVRVFRADRIEGPVELGADESFEVPDDFRPEAELAEEPWQLGGGEPTPVRVRVDAGRAADLAARARHPADVEWQPDGGVVVTFAVTNVDGLRSLLFEYLEHAEVLDPPEVRAGVVEWLEAVVAAGGAAGVSPRQGAEDELTRVLALVPWIIAHPGSTKDEIAERFGISVPELERDLWLLMMVGVPPYSPGDYIDVDPESDTVEIRLADYFTRPLRLSPAEGLALLAAGRALLAVPGSDSSGPLATAIGKLAHALEGVDVVVDFGEPEFLDEVREAARAGRRIEIEYWSAGRDHRSTRRIDPGPPFFAVGQWYTDAYCHHAGDNRMFRLDRIRAVRPTDETFVPAGDDTDGPPAVFTASADDVRVTLDLPAGATWVAETTPVDSVEDLPDGGQRVVLTVGATAWLERLLLQVGPAARIVDPPDLRDLPVRAARRVLTRYAGDARAPAPPSA